MRANMHQFAPIEERTRTQTTAARIAKRTPPTNVKTVGRRPSQKKRGGLEGGEGSRAPHVDRSSCPAPGAARQAWPGARKEFSKSVETRSNPFSPRTDAHSRSLLRFPALLGSAPHSSP